MVHFTFYHVCLCVCFLLYVYHTSTEDSKGQRRVSDALELELHVVVSLQVGIKVRSLKEQKVFLITEPSHRHYFSKNKNNVSLLF